MLSFFNPDATALTPAEHQAETEQLRHIAQCMHLFGLCRYKRCFRDEVCLHDPRDCVARYAPLTSEQARAFMRTLLDHRVKDEDDIERLGLGDEDGIAEFMDWRALMDNARKPGTVGLKYLFERSEEDSSVDGM